MKKHVVKRFFDTYPDDWEKRFDTEEEAMACRNELTCANTRYKVTYEYTGMIDVKDE